MLTIPNLDSKLLKGWGRRDLVKKSPTWSFEETGNSLRTPAWTFSLTIWQSISKCLVRSWNTRLAAMWIALRLSQYITGFFVHWIFKSFIKYNSHCISHEVEASALYSASEEDLDTVSCFLVLHETSDLPMKKHWPDMDLLVSLHPAQSASEKPWMWNSESLGKNIPEPGQPLRYFRTLMPAL